MKKRKWIGVVTALLIAVLAFTGCGGSGGDGQDSGADGGDTFARTFGEFEAELYGGGVVSQDIFAEADLTMVNVWATYCGFCIDEMPYFEEFSKEYKDDGLQVVGIVTDISAPDDEAAGQIIEETGTTYRHIIFNQDMWSTYLKDVQAVPTTVFVNSKGEIVDEQIGAKSHDKWKEIIEELL